MRGKHVHPSARIDLGGITPARAGKTIRGRDLRTGREDHPRACGENIGNSSLFLVSKGSPPRVRGKHYPPKLFAFPDGITPARAGKTKVGISVDIINKDHPRACGENRDTRGKYWS